MEIQPLIPLLAALAGAVVGGGASVLTIWIQQSAHSRREKMKLASELALENFKMVYENMKERRKSGRLLPLAAWQHLHYEILSALEKGNLTEADVRRIWKENNKIEATLVELKDDP